MRLTPLCALVPLLLAAGCASTRGDDPGSTDAGPFRYDGGTSAEGGAAPTPAAYVDGLGVGLDVDWSKTSTGMSTYAPQMVVDFMACQLRAAGVPYAVNSDSKFYDRETLTWIPAMAPVVDAFVQPSCGAPGG